MRMKNIIFLVIMLAITLSVMATPTLARDNNSEAMQFCRTYVCYADTIPAQAPTVADSVAVPTNTVQATIIGRHQAMFIRAGATASTTGLAASWIYVPKDVPIIIPVINSTYIVYKSATGAAKFNVIWWKM